MTLHVYKIRYEKLRKHDFEEEKQNLPIFYFSRGKTQIVAPHDRLQRALALNWGVRET